MKATSVCEMDEFEECPCICVLLLWGVGQISLGFGENPTKCFCPGGIWVLWLLTAEPGYAGAGPALAFKRLWRGRRSQSRTQISFLWKSNGEMPLMGDAACPGGCRPSVLGSHGDGSIPIWWQLLLPLAP